MNTIFLIYHGLLNQPTIKSISSNTSEPKMKTIIKKGRLNISSPNVRGIQDDANFGSSGDSFERNRE